MNKKIIFPLIFLGVFIISFLFIRFYPIEKYSTSVEGMTPIKDDELANKYAPKIYSTLEYDLPTKILYRAAEDEYENIYISYHIFWDGESNPNSGILPMMNRLLYTGGLRLQKTMFGPGDIEVIEKKINSNGEVIRIKYETADNYNPRGFSVAHKWVTLKEEDIIDDIAFKVISWNHLFNHISEDMIDEEEYIYSDLDIAYFSNEDWNKYEMFKPTNTLIKRNRAHFDYARESVE